MGNPKLTGQQELSLRDYFGAQALNGMISSCPGDVDRTKIQKDVWADVAYRFADAMLEARGETGEERDRLMNEIDKLREEADRHRTALVRIAGMYGDDDSVFHAAAIAKKALER